MVTGNVVFSLGSHLITYVSHHYAFGATFFLLQVCCWAATNFDEFIDPIHVTLATIRDGLGVAISIVPCIKGGRIQNPL